MEATAATATKRCPGFAPNGVAPHDEPADLEHFNSNKGSKDGLSSRCRSCGNAYGTAWAKAKREGKTFSVKGGTGGPGGSERSSAPELPKATVVVAEPPAAPKYHDDLAVAAHRGKAKGYTAELVGEVWFALPEGNGEVTSAEGQAALQAVNEARATERRRRDAERKRAERAAAKARAAGVAKA